jgi:hypothetical protein
VFVFKVVRKFWYLRREGGFLLTRVELGFWIKFETFQLSAFKFSV